MQIDWKIWNYKGKKVAQAHFFLFAFIALLLILDFEHDIAPRWIIVFAILSAAFACFRGYRGFFFSEDWFRAKEAQRADWWDNHPRLRNTYSASGWIFYFLIIAYLLWKTYRK